MRETSGDLFDLHALDPISVLVVTTNGCLTARGELVMGAGLARSAASRFPALARTLGDHVREHGNTPLLVNDLRVLSWPTKPGPHALTNGTTHPGWRCMSSVKTPECRDAVGRLTARSARLVHEIIENEGLTRVLAPRVGCGLAGLDWAKVGPWLAAHFDDRLEIVTPPS